MNLLKLECRYLNLEHLTSVTVRENGIEVMTPFELMRFSGADAERVLWAVERLAEEAHVFFRARAKDGGFEVPAKLGEERPKR